MELKVGTIVRTEAVEGNVVVYQIDTIGKDGKFYGKRAMLSINESEWVNVDKVYPTYGGEKVDGIARTINGVEFDSYYNIFPDPNRERLKNI